MPPAPSARVRGLAALVVAALTAAVLALVMSAPPAHASDVGISNYAFAPASIEVHPGDSVTWTNHDKASHTVSTMLVLWDGRELLDADATFSGNDHLATELLGIKPTRRHALEDGLLAGFDYGG